VLFVTSVIGSASRVLYFSPDAIVISNTEISFIIPPGIAGNILDIIVEVDVRGFLNVTNMEEYTYV
jgi:lipoprotein signal peptidase